jgi:DNA mismatch endonuclease, patch repair protein
MPKSNVTFWGEKFEANVRRDMRAVAALLESGWRVLTIWECGLTNRDKADACADFVLGWLRGGEHEGEYPSGQVDDTRIKASGESKAVRSAV